MTLRPRQAAATIAGFWSFFLLLSTLRSLALNPPGEQVHLLVLRLLVCGFSLAITPGLYLALDRLAGVNFGRRAMTAAVLCSVAACTYAGVNARVYRDLELCAASPAAKAPGAAVPRPATLATGGQMLGSRSDHDCASNMLEIFADHAVNGYFLMATWAALYLALCYAAEVKDLERRAAELRAAAQSAELRALRYQVNPHFLFNTLNALSSLVMTRRPEEAERMIVNLSRFFRSSLAHDPTEDVPLREEVQLQRLYLDIEAVRFPERLRVEIDVPEELQDACVPGLILQPLVENAVKHGVAASRGPVTLRIRARRLGDALELMVEDDAGSTRPSKEGAGLGLRNVADRLAARYGARAQSRAGPASDGGFAAVLSLPLVLHGC